MKTWIITGGIGTGKSTVCDQLKAAGLASFSADDAVHEAYQSPTIRKKVAEALGMEAKLVRQLDPTIFRAAARAALVAAPERREALEGVLHPEVWKAYQRCQKEARSRGEKVLVAEIPLYYETGAVVKADRVIVVAASRATQLARLQARRGLDISTASDMLAMQMPLERKIEQADAVIWNDGDLGALEAQIALLLQPLSTPLSKPSMPEVLAPPAETVTTTSPPPAPEPVVPAASETVTASPAPAAAEPAPAAPAEASGPEVRPPSPDGQPVAEAPFPVEQSINALQEMTPAALNALAETIGWRTNASRTKHQLVNDLLTWMGNHRTRLFVEGIVEIGNEGYGVIRYPKYSFMPLPEDVFVPAFITRKFGLRCGQRLAGYVKPTKDKDKNASLDRLTHIEGVPVEQFEQPTPYDKLTALFPSQRIILETPKEPSVSSRVVDIVAPLGKGQRAIIMASPRSGKTILLKDMAKSITVNHPEISLIVLLLDERPEEVTDFEETVTGPEIYSSTFDESPKRHGQVAELVLERAKRLVEARKDVVLLLDSITRLARGYNNLAGGKGRTGTGGLDHKAKEKARRFFGAARNVEEGGSLTIIGTALVETENKMDDIIFEEFKGTGNMEICLDREMAERRIYPAIHVTKSGTRRDDLLYHPDEFKRIAIIRRQLAAVPAIEAMELLIRNMGRTKSNAELLLSGLK